MKQVIGILNRALERRSAGWILLACVGAAYCAAYFTHPLFPGFEATGAAKGWLTWTDQSRYLAESLALAQLQLSAKDYFYPLGYPVLGALFVKWMPNNAFFLPNLLLVVCAAAVWWRLARRWVSPVAALGVGIGFVFSHPWLVRQTMIVPWNTIATQFTLLLGIALVIEKVDTRVVRWLAILAAATYLTRPSDVVAFGPLLIVVTLRLATWKARLLNAGVGLAIVGAGIVAVGCFNLWLIGQWRTVYEMVSTQTIGFFSYPVSYKLFWLFVDGQPLFDEVDQALLFRYPWLVLTFPAMAFLVVRERWAGAAVAAAITLNVMLYVNYNDLLPSDIYRFTLIHYIAWAFPLLFVLAAAACREALRNPVVTAGFGLSAITALLVVGLRLEPRAIETEKAQDNSYALPVTRPLLIEFPETPSESIRALRVDGRQLVEYSEYLVPYVPSNLKLLLGTRTPGTKLEIAAEVGVLPPPIFSRYEFGWRLASERLDLFAPRKNY